MEPDDMANTSGECGAVRPGYSATFNACMRGAGHRGNHMGALGARWSDTDEQRVTTPATETADRH